MNVLIPGSFDPITLGHLNIVERAAPMFEKVFVAVMNNDAGKYDKNLNSKVNMFTSEQRLDMVRLSVAHIPNVQAVYHSGRLVDFCSEHDIRAVIRGVRDAKDFEYEMIHAEWNMSHYPKAQALFMPADKKFDFISATAVRRIITENRSLSELDGMLSDEVIEYIEKIR